MSREPLESSPEHNKQFKPENNSGCCNGGSNACGKPSKAIKGSPRWDWEQEYGKLATNITKKIGSDGRWFFEVIKTPCGKPSKRKERKGCCALRYRVAR